MSMIKSGDSKYGFCYIEKVGVYYYVHIGESTYGPYTNEMDAFNEYSRWCL